MPAASSSVPISSQQSSKYSDTSNLTNVYNTLLASSLEYIVSSSINLSISLTLLAIVLTYFACFSGVSAIPSLKPSTYPLIAVRGVFRSWEMFLISSFSSLSDWSLSSDDFFNIRRISSKSLHTSPISLCGTLGISKSKLPSLILSVASLSLLTGLIIELYIHRLRIRLVIARISIITTISSTIICLICGTLCLTEVSIDTLYIFPKSSVKSTCFIRL